MSMLKTKYTIIAFYSHKMYKIKNGEPLRGKKNIKIMPHLVLVKVDENARIIGKYSFYVFG